VTSYANDHESRIDKVLRAPGNYPSGKAGDVLIPVDTQAEIERLTNALSAIPEAEQCAESMM
jgi:hypothetical protein